jgi:hypothetical protein
LAAKIGEAGSHGPKFSLAVAGHQAAAGDAAAPIMTLSKIQ